MMNDGLNNGVWWGKMAEERIYVESGLRRSGLGREV
jgi:hypothetical protein